MVNAGFIKVPRWIFSLPESLILPTLKLVKLGCESDGSLTNSLRQFSKVLGTSVSRVRTILSLLEKRAHITLSSSTVFTQITFCDDYVCWGDTAQLPHDTHTESAQFEKKENKKEKVAKRNKQKKESNQEEEEVRNNGYHLSKQRKDHFISAGKVEVIDDVFMTEKELRILEVLHGEEILNWALMQVSDWASNPNPDKKGRPSYKSFHEKEDHYRVVKNQIDRAKANGFGPFKKEAMCD